MLIEIINLYGAEIIGTLLLALAGVLGMIAKNLATKYLDNDTKRTMAKVVVQFVEQVYKDIHGEEKLAEALVAASEMLAEKGITITDLELRVLIEAAVAEFSEAFEKKHN